MYSAPYLFWKTSKIRIYGLKIFKLQQFQFFLWILNLSRQASFDNFVPKKLDCTLLCVSVILAPKAVESCSKAQKTQQVFWSALEKNFFGWGVCIFCEWLFTEGLLGHLDPHHLARGPNCQKVVFRWSYCWKLGYNLQQWVFWYFGWPAGVSGSKVMI